ncbi:MAG: hypothetical protein IE913_02180 [Halothiobacillus sp.]|nr:hypothetical protein [Halothiobacillus sp.]
MMPVWLGSLFLIGFGSGVLAVAYRGWQHGELPAGVNGFKPYRPNREDNPLGFHFFFALYICAGIALVVWGLLALIGMAPPLKFQ